MRCLPPLLLLAVASTSLAKEAAKETRHHRGVELSIQNLQATEADRCTVRPFPVQGETRCGKTPYISEVRWKYLSSSEKGDIYLFMRRFPTEGRDAAQESKVIEYTGKELILWEDPHQRLLLREGK